MVQYGELLSIWFYGMWNCRLFVGLSSFPMGSIHQKRGESAVLFVFSYLPETLLKATSSKLKPWIMMSVTAVSWDNCPFHYESDIWIDLVSGHPWNSDEVLDFDGFLSCSGVIIWRMGSLNRYSLFLSVMHERCERERERGSRLTTEYPLGTNPLAISSTEW